MEILLWLVPPLGVTLVAMAWAGWAGRAGRGRVGREEMLRRMGEVLERVPTVTHAVARPPAQPASGVAVRRPESDRTGSTGRNDETEQPGPVTRRRAS